MPNIVDEHSQSCLVVIAGPTAVGKTQVAINLAKKLNAEIISADSRQFYQGMETGTAAPSGKQLGEVKHHFIGNLNVTETTNVYDYERKVLKLLKDLFSKNQFVVLTGGSGLYLNAICYGIDELPDADEQIRFKLKKELETAGIESLQKKLLDLDPEYYHEVDLKNPNRLMRAIEVCLITDEPFSKLRKHQPKKRPFQIIQIGLELPREELFERIYKRVDQMMIEGLQKEAKGLVNYRNYNALKTVGYKELFDYFDGECTLDEAVEKIKINTRKYAKRQMTWLKKNTDIRWFSPSQTDEILQYVFECCN